MTRNAFIFHGTAGFPNENWFPWLKEKLTAEGYCVTVPQFPTPKGESFHAWRDVLQEHINRIDRHTMFVAHSLGGIFLLKLLESLECRVALAAFVGTPVGVRPILNYERDIAFAGYDFNWPRISCKADRFVVFQSDNDPYVSLANGEKLARELGVSLSFVPGAGHFNTRSGFTEFHQLYSQLRCDPKS